MYFLIFLLFALFLVIIPRRLHLSKSISNDLIAYLGNPAKGKGGEYLHCVFDIEAVSSNIFQICLPFLRGCGFLGIRKVKTHLLV